MAQVFITREIPKVGLDKLAANDIDYYMNPEDRPLTYDEIISGIEECRAIICMPNDQIDSRAISVASRMKIIANFAVGYNNIDVRTATNLGIFVTNTPDVLTETTADLAWSLMLAVARRVVEGDKIVRAGEFRVIYPLYHLGSDIHGKTLGVIGAGRIGSAVIRRAAGFGMDVLYNSRSPKPELEKDMAAMGLNIAYAGLEELLKKADYVVLVVPLTKETEYLITKKELGLMKPESFLINISRGLVVREADLVQALREKRIAGAGLDVYEREPALEPGLAELDNVVLTPHIGSATVETRNKMCLTAVDNVLAAMDGHFPPNLVNRDLMGI
jgi:glyoxylate reductase